MRQQAIISAAAASGGGGGVDFLNLCLREKYISPSDTMIQKWSGGRNYSQERKYVCHQTRIYFRRHFIKTGK